MRTPWLVVIAAGCMLDCGGNGGNAASSFQVKGVVASIAPSRTCNDRGTPVSTTVLGLTFSTVFDTAFLSDPANACAAGRNETSYVVGVWVNGGNPLPSTPGSYQVHQDASGGMAGFVAHFDASCSQTLPNVVATSGTLQLTTLSSTRVAGRVDLVFEDGRTASDAFDAPVITTAANACGMLGVPDATGTVPNPCATITCH
jgi:hypothetical protein